MKLFFAGDIAPGLSSSELPEHTADYAIANLETPIVHSRQSRAAIKSGPHLCSSKLPANVSRWILNLANNHLMDFGIQGLESTCSEIASAGANFFGAGQNLSGARQFLYKKSNAGNIAFIGTSEKQFGCADRVTAGVAGLGSWISSAILEAKKNADFVVVSVHAGIEESPWPEPWRQELFRSFVELGADVIHGHHPHLPQGYEVYKNAAILYSGGNFIVPPTVCKNSLNRISVAFQVEIQNGKSSVVPIFFQSTNTEADCIKPVQFALKENPDFSRYWEDCMQPIENPDLLEALFQEMAVRLYFHRNARLAGIPEGADFGRGGWFSFARQTLEFFKRAKNLISSSKESSLSNERLSKIHLLYNCESHREALQTASGLFLGIINDRRSLESSRLIEKWLPEFSPYNRCLRK